MRGRTAPILDTFNGAILRVLPSNHAIKQAFSAKQKKAQNERKRSERIL